MFVTIGNIAQEISDMAGIVLIQSGIGKPSTQPEIELAIMRQVDKEFEKICSKNIKMDFFI